VAFNDALISLSFQHFLRPFGWLFLVHNPKQKTHYRV
jgi:hypothetical protein